MYIRSIVLVFISLILLNPLQSNPLVRFQRLIVNPNNRTLVAMGTGYFVGVAGFCTILYKNRFKRDKRHTVPQKQSKNKSDNIGSGLKNGGCGGIH